MYAHYIQFSSAFQTESLWIPMSDEKVLLKDIHAEVINHHTGTEGTLFLRAKYHNNIERLWILCKKCHHHTIFQYNLLKCDKCTGFRS